VHNALVSPKPYARALGGLCALLITAGTVGCGSTVTQTERPWRGPATAPPPHLASGTRGAIDRVLDQFVVLAVERHNPAKAYDLVTPSMRYQQSRSQWAAGTLPVPPFAAQGRTFHSYSVTAATRTDAFLQLILHGRASARESAISYNVHVKRVDGRWLVDWFTPSAFFGSTKNPSLTAEPDFGPSASGGYLQPKHHANLIFLGVLGLLTLPFLVAGVFLVVHLARGRLGGGMPPREDRWAQAMRRTGR
jgi:phage terminase large subunit-like protein